MPDQLLHFASDPKGVVSSTAFRIALFDLASKPGSAPAERVLAEVGAAFARLAGSEPDPAMALRWRSESEALADVLARSPRLEVRLVAAERLADTYASLSRSTAGGTTAWVPAARTGPLSIAAAGGGNAGLAQLLELWGAGGRITPPVIEIRGPSGAAVPCVPGTLRAQVRKPGLLAELGDAGLDPDFLAYLRETGALALRSYAIWRAAQPVDALGDADSYQVALGTTYRAYEEARFADRYCRPGDIPAPGEQHGHRLLRLPLQLGQDDFRDAGCGPQIYEGELGLPDPLELDYQELVRRYVDLLKPRSRWRADVNAITRSDIVTSHLRHVGNADDPTVLHLMIVASQTALQLRSMATLIDLDDDLRRQGLALAAWLMGPAAGDIRSAVLDAWRRIVVPQPGASAPAAAMPGGVLSVNAFSRALTALCLPSLPQHGLPALDTIEPRLPHRDPGAFYPAAPLTRSAAEVLAEAQRLVGVYDAVWSQAAQLLGPGGLREARNEIRLSGLEARAHIAWLAVACVVRLNVWQFGGPAGQRDTVQALQAWLTGIAVPIDYDDVIGRLPDYGNQAVQGHQPKQYWRSVPAAAAGGPAHYEFEDEAHAALALVVDAYAATLDAVVSGSSAQGAAPATGSSAAPVTVREADLPALLQRWTQLFVELLNEQRQKRLAVDEPLLVLRLVPRRGRYGETPQRTASEELERELKTSAWPGHPTRSTEGYVLEPLPRRYFMRYHPQLYLREDYRLKLMPRGYGIGANLYSMSMLPQEEQTVVVKSFKDTRSKVSESTAENVFEEAGSETSNDFANELASETQQEASNQTDITVAAKASASFLFGSAELSSGYGSKDSSRDFAKNVSNLTSKLAQKLSSKRTVAVETKRTGETEEGTRNEVSTERKFKNPNMGHTVTFHWFQMTRKFLQELWLEDAKLVYTSGKHNVLRILANGELPPEVRPLATAHQGTLGQLLSALPEDVARRMPPGAAVVIVSEPYTEVVSLAGANAFLSRVFATPRAVEVNSALWRSLGYFDAAPDGLGVLAYPGNRRADPAAATFVPLDNLPDPRQVGDPADPATVVADTVRVLRNGALMEEPFYLPNLDLRYRARDGQPPARYTAAPYDAYALPQLLQSEERVVNTNGVFCEAMVGRCTALEDYLQRHRELDLLEKKISVGRQEIEFRWNLAKDHLVAIEEDADHAVVALVRPAEGEQPFSERIALEQAQLAQQRGMAEAGLDRQKTELELAFRQEQVNELQQRIALMAVPPELRIDAPEGATVAVNANVDLGHRTADPGTGGASATLSVE